MARTEKPASGDPAAGMAVRTTTTTSTQNRADKEGPKTRKKRKRGPAAAASSQDQGQAKRSKNSHDVLEGSEKSGERQDGGRFDDESSLLEIEEGAASTAKEAHVPGTVAGAPSAVDGEGGGMRGSSASDQQQQPRTGGSANGNGNGNGNVAPPMVFAGLEKEGDGWEVTKMSILSSGRIQKKVTRCLGVLCYPGQTNDKKKEGKGKLVMMYAKAGVVAKMISVAEIVKREVAREGGKWFQYCVVGEVVEARKTAAEGEAGRGDGGGGVLGGGMEVAEEEEEEEEEEGEGFETMKTPFERAIEGREKVRSVPNMCLYLSRTRVEALRKAYGEQTNAVEKKD